jgi:hypothetical protein
MYTPLDNVEQPLYVIAVVFNPVRFKSRWKLFRDFQRHVRESGAILITLEAAFGEREFALEAHGYPANPATEGDVPQFRSHGPANVPPSAVMPASRLNQDYIKVRLSQQQEIWLKENLQNVALQHLPPDAKYVAFIDADVQFLRPDWVSETLHALQHYDVVQMFKTAVDVSPTYDLLQAHTGFVASFEENLPLPASSGYYYHGAPSAGPITWHPGFAWAWRKSALDTVGTLYDQALLGAGDRHMAMALIGRGAETIPEGMAAGYRKTVMQWQEQASALNRNIGYIAGTVHHFWHGRKVNRKYHDRWKILVRNQFDPTTDLKRDSRGVYALTDKKPQLRDDVRSYFRARQEDSIDVPGSDHKLLTPAPVQR